jgi:hypothetical protein
VKGAYPHVAFTDFLHGRTGTFALWTGPVYVHVQLQHGDYDVAYGAYFQRLKMDERAPWCVRARKLTQRVGAQTRTVR